MNDVVLDANALTRWADKHPGILALLEATRQAGGAAHVPTVCLVEALQGNAADATINQRLKGCQIAALDTSVARHAAGLRATIDSNDIVDPVVTATAAALSATALSTDPNVQRLATYCNPPVAVVNPDHWNHARAGCAPDRGTWTDRPPVHLAPAPPHRPRPADAPPDGPVPSTAPSRHGPHRPRPGPPPRGRSWHRRGAAPAGAGSRPEGHGPRDAPCDDGTRRSRTGPGPSPAPTPYAN